MTERINNMIDLKTAIEKCEAEIKNDNFCQETIWRYLSCLKKLQKLADDLEFDKPCQNLFDEYLKRHTSFDDHVNRKIIIKRLDRIAGTNCLNENGILYNMKPFLSREELNDINKYHFPLPEGVDLHTLISYALSTMKDKHRKSTYGQYIHAFSYLYSWSLTNGYTSYDKNILQKYLNLNEEDYLNGKIHDWIYKIRKRSINILLEVAETGKFEWHIFIKKKTIEDWKTKLLFEYLEHFDESTSFSDSYLYLHRYVFLEFLNFLEVSSKEDLIKLNRKDFENLCERLCLKFSQNSIGTIYPIARKVITFLYESELIDNNYSVFLLSPNYFREYNPCIISREDEVKIINHLDNCSLRDKAIMLLAIRYGLRDSDICELKIQEIDWHKEIIAIVQKKTKEPLVLPLLDDVGNAIIDYIENERPKVSSPYIFLRKQMPYKKISGAYSLCSNIVDRLDIKTSNGKGKGIHIFRYTLAKRLLETQTPHQIITDSLGHISKQTDKYYYSMEDEKLKMCCLDARWIGVKTWK